MGAGRQGDGQGDKWRVMVMAVRKKSSCQDGCCHGMAQ